MKKCGALSLWSIDFFAGLFYDIFMADVIELIREERPAPPRVYSVEVTQYPDNLMFTLNDIKVSASSLSTIADELERIVRIIRTDVVTGAV